MQKLVVGLLTLVLLSGCTKPTSNVKPESDSSSEAGAIGSLDTSSPQKDATQLFDSAEASVPIDAAQLLATTLKTAKAQDKRIIVHLGAPG